MNKDEMSMTADWLQEGIAQAKVGEKDEAGRLLQVAAEMSPNNEVVWLWLAVVSETKSDKIEYLTKALTINPNNQRTAKMLGQLKGEQVKTASWRCPMCLTVAEGRQMVCSTCASVLSLTDLGGLLGAKVDRDLVKPAITRYQNMLGKGVDFGVHYNLTLAFLNLGELDAGISHLQQAVHLKPLNKGLQHQHDLLVAHQTAMQAVALVDEPDYEAMGMVTTTSPPVVSEPPPPVVSEPPPPVVPTTQSCPICLRDIPLHIDTCPICQSIIILSDIDRILQNRADGRYVRRAIEGYRRALEQEVDYDAYFNLGLAFLNNRQLAGAITQFEAALVMRPQDTVLQAQLDDLHNRQAEAKASQRHSVSHTKPSLNGLAKPPESEDTHTTILAVDDSPTIGKLVSLALSRHGYKVVVAKDGMEALGKLGQVNPDLVLLDITMPKMDGYQVCKAIRGNTATRHIPVIMLSGKDGFFDKVRGRLAGSTDYITKPFAPEKLLNAVQKYR